ncbi:MAG: SDR family NAD(P)-dependent oxidoreductase [Magnetococcus sp. DMHC-1]
MGFPVLIILLPTWYLYRWTEIRAGRPAPVTPWHYLQTLLQSRKAAYSLQMDGRELGGTFTDDFATNPDPEPAKPENQTENPGRPQQTPLLQATCGEKNGLDTAMQCEGVALVTGGGKRLGATLCQELARLGFAVAVVYHHSEPAARRLAKDLRSQGGQAEALAVDLANPARILSLLHDVERGLGPVRLLVNNAGVFAPTRTVDGSWEAMDALFKSNLQGPLWLSLKAAENMRRHGGGLIINMADLWGERPLAGHAAYCASKAGLIMATQVLARDLAPQVRVNAIAPGGILPPDSPTDAAPFQTLLQHTPLAHHANPDAVLRAVRYLLAAPFVTGEILHVDGGRRLV